jgi:acyl-CoA reductase-like NAD-dependent aldehyde dehydrogenase
MDPTVDVGTVINEKSAALFERRVEDAVAKGAKRLHGEKRDGALFPPTVVDHIPYDCELVREETFGPVIPMIRCPNDIGEVIKISNSTAFGLSSGVCTNRLDYITRFISDLDVGTVIHERAATLFQNRVSEAVAKHGAKLLHGNDRQGALFPPTVVDHVDPACELVREETFGPAIPIIRVKDIAHAIQVSNGTAYGLSSGVCTDRLDYITRFVDELQVGTVNVWEVPGYRIEMSPFGGIKDSGLGYKEGVLEAMKSFTNVKTWSLPWPS